MPSYHAVLYYGAFLFFLLSQAALWALSQIMCINTNSTVDGSFVSTLCTMISVIFFYLAWKTVTEDQWDEVTLMSEGDRMSQGLMGQHQLHGHPGHQSVGATSSRYETL